MDFPKNSGYKLMPPDGGYGWVVVASATVITGLISTSGIVLGLLFNDMMELMSASAAQVATIASILSFSANLTGPFSASYAQRTSCRRGVILAGLIIASAIFCSVWVKSVQLLTFTMGCMLGFGNSFGGNASLYLINDYFLKRRGLAIGIRTTGYSIGRAVLPPLLQYLLFEYGYHGLLLISSAILLNICVCGALYQPAKRHLVHAKLERIEEVSTNQTDEEEATKNAHIIFAQLNKADDQDLKAQEDRDKTPDFLEKVPEKNKVDNNFFLVLKRIYSILLGQIQFSMMKTYIFYLFITNHLANSLIIYFAILFLYPYSISKGFGSMNATYIMSAFGFSDIAGRLVITSLMDIPKLGAKNINIACCLATATILLGLTLANSFPSMLIVVCFFGFCVGGQLSGFVVLCTICVGSKKLPTVMGLSQFFQAFVLLAFGPILGMIRDVTNDFRICYYVLSAFSYIAALAWIVESCIQRKRGTSTKAADEKFE